MNELDAILADASGAGDSELDQILSEANSGNELDDILAEAQPSRDLRNDPLLRGQIAKWDAYENTPLTQSLPRVGAALLGLAVPASIPAQVAGGLLLSSGARATSAALEGEDVWGAANPWNNKLDTALDVAIPVGTGAFSRGMRAQRLDETLPDFEQSTSANAPLPPRHEVLTRPELGDRVPRAAVEPTTGWGRFRQFTMNPKRYLMRADDPGVDAPPSMSRIAGETLEGYRAMREQIQQQAERAIRAIEEGLSPQQRAQAGLILDGRLEPGAVDRVVLDAVQRARQFTDQIGTRATNIEGMSTLDDATGERIPFRMREGDHLPHVLLAEGGEDTVALARRGNNQYRIDPTQRQRHAEHPRGYEMDIGRQLRAYVDDFSRDMAASHYFGPRGENSRWGTNADAIWENLIAEGDPLRAAAFESRMETIMHPERLRNPGRMMQAVQRLTSKVALPTSAITSWSQAGTNLARHGLGNTVEGMVRWMRDPSMRELYESSGALNPGFTEMATEGATRQTIGSRWMASTERGLRGFMNAGAVPYAERLLQAVRSGDRSRSTLRRLRELGLTVEEAQGETTADLMRRVVQRSSDDLQLQAHDPVNAGEFFDSPSRRTMAAYMQYPAEATRLFHDMVIDPVISGVRNLDAGEVVLGAGRLGRWGGGAALASGAAEAARATLSGREPQAGNAVLNAVDTVVGLPAMPITTLMRGFDPAKGALQPPAVSMAGQAIRSGRRLFGDDTERGVVELALDLAAILDPTGAAAVGRQIGRSQLNEAYK